MSNDFQFRAGNTLKEESFAGSKYRGFFCFFPNREIQFPFLPLPEPCLLIHLNFSSLMNRKTQLLKKTEFRVSVSEFYLIALIYYLLSVEETYLLILL